MPRKIVQSDPEPTPPELAPAFPQNDPQNYPLDPHHATGYLLRPPAIPEAASATILSPASTPQRERVEHGAAALVSLGFAASLAPHALTRGPLYFAGTTQQRLDDLHAAFADESTQLLLATRGGYGSNHLLDGLDLSLLAAHPKPFFAYSDLTALQIALFHAIGLPSFHGPMLSPDFARPDGVHLPSLRAALSGTPYSVGPAEGLRLLRNGDSPHPVRGTLYGGCLSILTALIGTPWEPAPPRGSILFLEDVSARPYQIHRMLWQLLQASLLDDVRAIVFGQMLDCTSPGAPADLLEAAILSALEDFPGPIAIGLRSGHVSGPNVTLTLGVAAELRPGLHPTLHLLEPAVQSAPAQPDPHVPTAS